METFTTAIGQVLRHHDIEACQGQVGCPMHNPSDHPLAWKPMAWDSACRIVRRRCEHDLWHPDVDSINYMERRAMEIQSQTMQVMGQLLKAHDCDGCCGINIPS